MDAFHHIELSLHRKSVMHLLNCSEYFLQKVLKVVIQISSLITYWSTSKSEERFFKSQYSCLLFSCSCLLTNTVFTCESFVEIYPEVRSRGQTAGVFLFISETTLFCACCYKIFGYLCLCSKNIAIFLNLFGRFKEVQNLI